MNREAADQTDRCAGKPLLKHRRWRLVTAIVAVALDSLFFQYVIEAPIDLPDSFLALPVMSLWQPLFGLPLMAFLTWWVLDRRISPLVLVLPLFLIGFCGRLLIGSPPQRSEEELQMMEEELGDHFIEEHWRNSEPAYKRTIFPPW